MSKFERSNANSAWADARELQFPDDFSPEDAAFARQLREFFAIDDEELPPLYAQTLLEEERFTILDIDFEKRIINQVFGVLELKADAAELSHHQQLPLSHPAPQTPFLQSHRTTLTERLWSALRSGFSNIHRPMAMAAILFLVFMVTAVVMATPSFAQGLEQGLRIILGETGAVQVQSPPIQSASPSKHQKNQEGSSASDPDATVGFDPNMSLFWPGRVADGYAYQGVQLQQRTRWSKGAIVDLQYGLLKTGAGSGTLDIREFQVDSADSAVLQVVQAGYATSVTLGDGSPAVYVSGMWEQRVFDRTVVSTWQTGTRCLLILERQGVVIWMAGDPRDGLNAETMASIAAQMVGVTPPTLRLNYHGVLMAAASLVVSVNDPLRTEWYLAVPASVSPASGTGQFIFSGTSTGYGPDSGN